MPSGGDEIGPASGGGVIAPAAAGWSFETIWRQVAHTSLTTIFSTAAAVLTLGITARWLGPSGRGIFAATFAWVSLFATLGNFSLGQVIIHHVAGLDRSEWLAEVTGAIVTLYLAATIIAAAVVTILYAFTNTFDHIPAPIMALAMVSLPFVLWSDAARYLLNALNLLTTMNWVQLAGSAAGVVLTVALVTVLKLSLGGATAAAVLSSALMGLVSFWVVFHAGGPPRMNWSLVGRLLRGSGRLHLNAIGTYLFAQATVLVLNYYRPAAETGYYQMAMQLFALVLIISNSIGTVAFGIVAQKGPDAAWPQQRTLLWQSLAIACVIGVVAYAVAPLAIRLVAGPRFLPAAMLFRLTLPALIGATLSAVMASQWIGRGLFIQAAILTLLIGIGSLACDLVLVPRRGMTGAVVSTWITYGISVVGNGGMAVWVQRRWSKSATTHR